MEAVEEDWVEETDQQSEEADRGRIAGEKLRALSLGKKETAPSERALDSFSAILRGNVSFSENIQQIWALFN